MGFKRWLKEVKQDSALAIYRMDERSTTLETDYSLLSRSAGPWTGTYSGNVARNETIGPVPGLSCARNTSSTGICSAATSAWFTGTWPTNFWFEAWVKAATIVGYDTIFGIGTSGDDMDIALRDGKFEIYGGGDRLTASGTAVSTGVWTHLMWTRTSGTTLNGYTNGVFNTSASFSGTPAIANSIRTLGNDNGTEPFDGSYCGMAIGAVEINATRVAAHYKAWFTPEKVRSRI